MQLAFPFFLAVNVGGLAGFYESENSRFDDYHWLAQNWMSGMLGVHIIRTHKKILCIKKRCCISKKDVVYLTTLRIEISCVLNTV